MYVREDIDVKNIDNYWSGAVWTMKRIEDAGKLDEYETFITNYFADDPEPPKWTELNDILWHDSDWVLQQLDIPTEDDESDVEEDGEDEIVKAILDSKTE